MKKIYSTEIECNSIANDIFEIEVEINEGAKPISVARTLDGTIKVYWEVETKKKKVETRLYCVGTGFGVVPETGTFLGTVVDGLHVWHIYY